MLARNEIAGDPIYLSSNPVGERRTPPPQAQESLGRSRQSAKHFIRTSRTGQRHRSSRRGHAHIAVDAEPILLVSAVQIGAITDSFLAVQSVPGVHTPVPSASLSVWTEVPTLTVYE